MNKYSDSQISQAIMQLHTNAAVMAFGSAITVARLPFHFCGGMSLSEA